MKIWKLKSELGEFENVELEWVKGERFSDLPKFWSCSGALMFSERAKECLGDIIGNAAEYIEAKVDNKKIVEMEQLVGFKYELVWDSEQE